MKKHLLLSAVMTATFAPITLADAVGNPATDPNCNPSSNLKLEWYLVPSEALVKTGGKDGVVGSAATGVQSGDVARTGIGSCGKFFVPVLGHGVYVYGENGLIEIIDNADTWLSINCDDAGHVYFRTDEGSWFGKDACYSDGTPGGLYNPGKATFSVIDAKTNQVIKTKVPLYNAPKNCRFDELPHVNGNMVEDRVEVPVVLQGKESGVEFIYDKLEPVSSNPATFNIGSVLKDANFPKTPNNAQTASTTAVAQTFNNGNSIAILANPTYQTTSSRNGWGNNIAVFDWSDDDDDFIFSGKWFNTPNHNACSGFDIFNYQGKNYILYPTGYDPAINESAADGFYVMPEELLDTPQNNNDVYSEDWKTQDHKPVAKKFATAFYGYGGTYRGLNVEPIEGEDGKFRIYLYCPYKVMEVWTLDLSGSTGIEDIVASKDEAKIFGGEGVVVTQSEGPAQVYTLAGQLVAQGKGTIAVPAGVYVVKADNKAAKVIVK